MSLAAGSRFLSFEIIDIAGTGGMGEVYRAHDPRLDRNIALKILPSDLASDPERVARLTREARLLASLNHPHIATIHGIEEDEGRIALVMELVEGPTLADRLAGGPLSVSDTIKMGRQVAEAVEAAHSRGIIHRDLKPSNLKFTANYQVKVLDFGIAKAIADDPAAETNSVFSTFSTRSGALVGTPAYMSPEQMTGTQADRRSDVWAFGCVMFEALTARRPFEGTTASDSIVRVLEREPDWSLLPASTPAELERIIVRCLHKEPRQRFQDIGDVRVLLDELATETRAALPSRTRMSNKAARRWLLPSGVTVGLLGILAATWSLGGLKSGTNESAITSRTMIVLPPETPFSTSLYPSSCLAVSPDGKRIVYCSGGKTPRLYMRRLDDLEVAPIAGSDLGVQPFFSPDGKSLAFFTIDGSLKKVGASGGEPVTLLKGLPYAGFVVGTWTSHDMIVFDTWNSGLRQVSANGGSVSVVSSPDNEWHQDPQALPNSNAILYTAIGVSGNRIEALSLDDRSPRVVLANASHARILPSGHLSFTRDGAVMVVPFDEKTKRVSGSPVPLGLKSLAVDEMLAAAPIPQMAVSRNGILVYARRRVLTLPRLLAVTRSGVPTEIADLPDKMSGFTVSPNGTRLALVSREKSSVRLQVFDLRNLTLTPVADYSQDFVSSPAWSPDGNTIYFAAFGTHHIEIIAHDLTGNAQPRSLWRQQGTYTSLGSVSSDDRWLVFSIITDIARGLDLWLLDLHASNPRNAARPFLTTSANEANASISPDGQWIAYTSDESGTADLYLRKFPGGELKQRVAVGTGMTHPRWSADGRELLYLSEGGERMMTASVQPGSSLVVGTPRELFTGHYQLGGDAGQSSGVLPDGRFLLVRKRATPDAASVLIVVQNWLSEVRHLFDKQ